MQDLTGVVADHLTKGYLEPCEIHDLLIRAGLTQEQAYLTYVGGRMIYDTRKAAFEAKQERKITNPTVKIQAVKAVSLTIDTPLEPIQLDDRTDPPGL